MFTLEKTVKKEKKLTRFTLFIAVSAILLLCTVISCGKSDKDQSQPVSDTEIEVSSEDPVDVSLSDVTMELGYGITRGITAVGGKQIEWKSSDENIATVDSEGNVRGIDLGECVITATNEFSRSAQCSVTVKKTCYLSIDDGPLMYASSILNALEETDAKATFFVVDSMYFPIVERMVDEGHAVGLHTRYNNTKRCYRDQYIYFTDLDVMNDHLEEITGTRSNIIRFPGGSNNDSEMLNMRRIINGAHDLGYRVFDWTISTGDSAANGSYENSCKAVFSNCRNKQEIILMHDKSFTAKVIRTIVPSLRNMGYVFETLDHFPEDSYEFRCLYLWKYKKDFPAESVTLEPSQLEVEQGSEYTLEAVLDSQFSTDFVVWQSSDESVAKVDKGGKVTGVALGNAVITARTTSGKTSTSTVTVIPKREVSDSDQ